MPHLRRATHQLYASATTTNEEEAGRNVDQILEFAGGAFIGFGTVYTGLDHAARTLGKSLANNTVQIVEHRYVF